MKTTKKIFAALLAVMMLLVMVPFSASAAEVPTQVTFNLDCTEEGYVFTVYQLATLNTTNGEYKYDIKSNVNADVAEAINTPTDGDNFSSAKIVELLKDDETANLGVALTDTFDTSSYKEKTYTVDSGIYYIKATTFPAGIKSSQSSLVVLPYYTGTTWETTLPTDTVNGKVTENTIHLAMKNSASTASSDKNILVDNTPVKNATTGYDNIVTYQLKASVMGSVENKIKSFIITDTMDDGLTFKKISKVYLTGGEGVADLELVNDAESGVNKYEVLGNNADGTKITVGEGEVATECTFAVSLDAANVLNTDDFYKYTNVIVEFEAEINKNAKVKVAIPNNSNLLYQNKDSQWADTDKQTVNVYTAGLKLYKTNAKNEPLADAVFGVYTNSTCTGDPIATATSGDDGYATFMKGENDIYKFASGTYYVKEISAPVGYILSDKITTVAFNTTASDAGLSVRKTNNADNVTIDNATGYVTVSAVNTPNKLPSTGGMGTMMFTIGGAALIVCAGALLFVLKRKAQ